MGRPATRTVEDLEDFSLRFDAGEVCDFDLRIRSLLNEVVVKTFYDAQGDPKREVQRGALTVRIKNIETGESQVRTWSGPYITWFNQDGSAHVSFPRRHVLWLFETDEGGPDSSTSAAPTRTPTTSRRMGTCQRRDQRNRHRPLRRVELIRGSGGIWLRSRRRSITP